MSGWSSCSLCSSWCSRSRCCLLLAVAARASASAACSCQGAFSHLGQSGARLGLPGPFPQGWEGLGSNKEWRQGEQEHGGAGEPVGLGLSWSTSLDRPFRGAGHWGVEGAGPAEPAPTASLRSRMRRDGVSWEMLGEAKAPWADGGQGPSWCHPAAEKPIRSLGSESGTGSPGGFLGASGAGRKQAGLAGTCDLLSESHASSRLPPQLTSDTFTRLQSANEIKAWSAGEGRLLDAAAKPCTLSLHSER